jgi:hypothetical protein
VEVNKVMAVIGGRNVGTNDLVVMGAGVLIFIDSFLPWWGAKHTGLADASGWNAGFGAWFSIILLIAVAGVTAARVFGGRSMPAVGGGAVSWTFLTAAVSALAAIIILLRWLTFPSYGGAAATKFGTYLGLIIAIVQAVFGYLSIQAAGEKLPWQNRTA